MRRKPHTSHLFVSPLLSTLLQSIPDRDFPVAYAGRGFSEWRIRAADNGRQAHWREKETQQGGKRIVCYTEKGRSRSQEAPLAPGTCNCDSPFVVNKLSTPNTDGAFRLAQRQQQYSRLAGNVCFDWKDAVCDAMGQVGGYEGWRTSRGHHGVQAGCTAPRRHRLQGRLEQGRPRPRRN